MGHVVPRAELVDRAVEMGARYAARNRGIIAAQKRIFYEHGLLPPADSLRAEGAGKAAPAQVGPRGSAYVVLSTSEVPDLPARRVGRRWLFLRDRLAAAISPLDDPAAWRPRNGA